MWNIFRRAANKPAKAPITDLLGSDEMFHAYVDAHIKTSEQAAKIVDSLNRIIPDVERTVIEVVREFWDDKRNDAHRKLDEEFKKVSERAQDISRKSFNKPGLQATLASMQADAEQGILEYKTGKSGYEKASEFIEAGLRTQFEVFKARRDYLIERFNLQPNVPQTGTVPSVK